MIKYFSILFLCFSNCFSMQKGNSKFHWFSLKFELPKAQDDQFHKLLTERSTWKIDGDNIITTDRKGSYSQPVSNSSILFKQKKHFFHDASFEKAGSKALINICGDIKNILSQDYFPGRDFCKCLGSTRSTLIARAKTNDHMLEELLAGIRTKKLKLGEKFKNKYGNGYIVEISPDAKHKPTSFSLDFFTYCIGSWKAE